MVIGERRSSERLEIVIPNPLSKKEINKVIKLIEIDKYKVI